MSQNSKPARFAALVPLIALCLVAFSIPMNAQHNETSVVPRSDYQSQSASETRNAGSLKTFISPNHLIQFKYSSLLVPCPADSCDAFFPMCDNQISPESHTLVCFAYEKNKLKDYPTFEAGTFSVRKIDDAITQRACMSLPPGEYFDVRRNGVTKFFAGVKFKKFDLSEAATSHGLDRQVYRTFHDGECYELNVKIAGIAPGVLAPGTGKEFDKKVRKEVRDHLQQPLHSFKFLK
jgi:hypothetical protein